MGLIDLFRKKVNKANDENKELKELGYGYNSIARQDGTEINVINQQVKMHFRHGNGEVTKLITANANIIKPGDTIIYDAGAPICFEIPVDMDVSEIFKKGFLHMLDQAGGFDHLLQDQYNVLGRAVIGNEQIDIRPVSDTVLENVESLNRELAKQAQDRELKYRQKEEQEEMKRKAKDEADAIKKKEMLEEQKKNITFKEFHRTPEGIPQSYQTVDQNTGRTIYLAEVKKIGKDEQSDYLYTGSMQVLDDIAYRLRDDLGHPVVFSSHYKLDDIEKTQDPELIQKISLLLSNPNIKDDQRTYLGQLNREGNVTRDLEDTSYVMQQNVKRLQSEYEKQRQRQFDEEAR